MFSLKSLSLNAESLNFNFQAAANSSFDLVLSNPELNMFRVKLATALANLLEAAKAFPQDGIQHQPRVSNLVDAKVDYFPQSLECLHSSAAVCWIIGSSNTHPSDQRFSDAGRFNNVTHVGFHSICRLQNWAQNHWWS
ncbi:hypothetical protein NQZ79_g8682 [Umbelopsis isabellina]|nr:hypothetical protein NQZ79_g8682 [Umbelopsis isabellina]